MKNDLPQFDHKQILHRRMSTILPLSFFILLVGSLIIALSLAHHETSSVTAAPSSAVPSGLGVYDGAGNGAFYKLDAASGAFRWRFQTHGRSIPAPGAVADGIVYFGSSDTNVYALQAATGSLLWKFQTGGPVLTSPVIAAGTVYVGSADGNVYALDAKSGTKLWSYFAGNANEAITPSTSVVDQGIVYASSSDNSSHSYLFALNAKTGKQLWRIQVDSQVFTSPQIANGLIYIASFAISQQTGPTVTDSFAYAFNAKDGSQRWRSAKVSDFILAAPTVANGAVYFGSRNTMIYALNAENGALLWQQSAGGAVSASLQVVNGVLYAGVGPGVSLNNTAILALKATDGSQVWRHAIANYAGTPLAVSGNALYVGSFDSFVFALKTSDGSQIWVHQDTAPFSNAPITVG